MIWCSHCSHHPVLKFFYTFTSQTCLLKLIKSNISKKENCFDRLIEWQKLHFHAKKMYIMKFILFRSVSSGDSRLSSKHKKSKKSKHHRRSPSLSPERSRRRSRSRSRRRSPSLERGRYRSRSRSRSRDRYSRRRSRSRDRRSRSYDRRSRSSSRSRRRSRYSRSLSRDRQRSKRYDINMNNDQYFERYEFSRNINFIVNSFWVYCF